MNRTDVIEQTTIIIGALEELYVDLYSGKTAVKSWDPEDKTFFLRQGYEVKGLIANLSEILSRLSYEKARFDLLQANSLSQSYTDEMKAQMDKDGESKNAQNS